MNTNPQLLEIVGTVLIVLFTFPEVFAEVQQAAVIKRRRNADAVPTSTNSIDVATFMATAIYGMHLGSFPYIFNGIVTGGAFLYVGIVIRKIRPASIKEWIIDGFLVLNLIAMMFFGKLIAEIVMGLFLIYTVWGQGQMLKEIHLVGRGAVEYRKLVTWIVTNCCFVYYSWIIRDDVFFWSCSVIVLIQFACLVLFWFKKPPPEQDE